MTAFFRIDHIFFTLFGYSMSYLEFVGTILNILSVWLIARKNIWCWPIGNVAVVLFGLLFYQIRLYSDVVEQIFFLITGFYGWWVWWKTRSWTNTSELGVRSNSRGENSVTGAVVVLGTLGMGALMSRVHLYFPSLFPEPASFPYLDAFTTVMSFVAQWLMVHKRVESWGLWIAIDVIGIGLYYQKHVVFVSLLYVLFLVLSVRGLLNWRRELMNPAA